jgi:hypothetical protein
VDDFFFLSFLLSELLMPLMIALPSPEDIIPVLSSAKPW